MAVKDYKDIRVILEGEIVDNKALIQSVNAAILAISKGEETKLEIGVNLKRRQLLSTYKVQIYKALVANQSSINKFALKHNITLKEGFLDTLKEDMLLETNENKGKYAEVSHVFTVLDNKSRLN
ncbi:hypothetical protein D3C81_10190 [compost metagenome]